MRYYIKYTLLLLAVLITSCKSNKNSVNESDIAALSTKKIINNHYHNNFDKKTVSAKMNARFTDKNTSVNFSIKLRIEKDKTIWMSATKLSFPVAKVKITPNRVSYYEKLDGTYFDGDFSLLSKWLGTELDFDKVQNLLLGQAVLNLKKEKYDSKIDHRLYQIAPVKENQLFGILFFLNPDNFKINRQEIRNPAKQQLLSVSYPSYKKINGEFFPEDIQIRAIDSLNLTTINIEYRSVEFNESLTFPFDIPNGYKEIKLK